MRIALLVHLVAAIVWIGGMFFAYVALRPAAAHVLEAPLRLSLWSETLGRFFLWVWVAIVAIHGSGFHMLGGAYGMRSPPPGYVLAMFGIASVMTLVFVYIFFVPFKALVRNVGSSNWKQAGSAMNRIRVLVAINLTLGMLTMAVAVIGGLLA